MTQTSPAKAVIILMDGLRPDPLQQGFMPVLQALLHDGAGTLEARSLMPSITLPCITSIMLSNPPQVHGTVTNTWHEPNPYIPGLFEVAHGADLQTASFHSWDPLRDLSRPEVVDFCYYHRSGDPVTVKTEIEIATVAADWISANQPGFSFIYMELPDLAGHKFGWMSDFYLESARRVDTALGLIVDRLAADTLLVITADHGGHVRAHGSDMPEDMTVPLVLHGPGILPGAALNPASLLDIAPTVAHLLGLGIPPQWQGRILHEALA